MHKSESIDRRRAVTLIGMAGVGKSTVGRLLAQHLGKEFVDTDDLIREVTGQRLQSLIQNLGLEGFLTKEAEVIRQMRISDAVIATGGSAVYGDVAMRHLKRYSYFVWLRQDNTTLIERIGDSPDARGLAMTPGQSIENLIQQREPLYAQYQDFTIQCESKTPEQLVQQICHSLQAEGFDFRKCSTCL